MSQKLWTNGGKVVVDSHGRLIQCPDCPCQPILTDPCPPIYHCQRCLKTVGVGITGQDSSWFSYGLGDTGCPPTFSVSPPYDYFINPSANPTPPYTPWEVDCAFVVQNLIGRDTGLACEFASITVSYECAYIDGVAGWLVSVAMKFGSSSITPPSDNLQTFITFVPGVNCAFPITVHAVGTWLSGAAFDLVITVHE